MESLSPVIKITLGTVHLKSMAELPMIKTLFLGTEVMKPFGYLFNKNSDGSPLAQSDMINSCRWSIADNSPVISICHKEALKIASEIRSALAQIGVETDISTSTSTASTGAEDMSIGVISRVLLFKVKHLKQWRGLDTDQDRVKFINNLLRKQFVEELHHHGADDEIISLASKISISGTSEQVSEMISDENFYMHTSTSSVAKAKEGNNKALRYGFKKIQINVPFSLFSKDIRFGYFKNIGFGQTYFKG